MSRVRIVTDSTADIPKRFIEELGIIVVPLKVTVGDKMYRDGVDITSQEIGDRMVYDGVLPSTSQPSPGEFVAVYERLISKGETVISIHLSGRLSGTVQSAQTAKTMTDSREIYVIDSKSASMGLGFTVIAAAKAAKEGNTVREILKVIKEKAERTFLLFLPDTLEYLEKGGRIGKAGALLGTLLKIKPILTIDEDGQVVALEKVRGKTRAIERIVEIIGDRTDAGKLYECALMYGKDDEEIIKLKELLSPVLQCNEPVVSELGPVIMSHTGPGLIGIVVSPQ